LHTFTNMEKDEYQKLFDYVSGKKLSVKNLGESGTTHEQAWSDSAPESSDEEHDVYMVKMKAEGRQKAAEAASMGADEDDDDDEQDEDFVPMEVDEPAEEYDSAAGSTSGGGDNSDSEAEGGGSSKCPKKEKKRREKSAKTIPEGGAGETRRKRGERAVKDANEPKRPMTAYFLFMNDKRAEIKAENPDAGVAEVAKLGGAMWKNVSDTDKAKWTAKHEEAKQAYEVAMKEYRRKIADGEIEAPSGGGGATKGKRVKMEKDPNAPKKPSSAYFLFMNEKRAQVKEENPDASIGDTAKIIGALWGKMSAEDKEGWNAKYEVAKERYNEEFNEYQRKIAAGEIEAPVLKAAKVRGGAGGASRAKSSPMKRPEGEDAFKSKEYVSSDSDSSALSSDEDKPKKPKAKVAAAAATKDGDDDEDDEDDEDASEAEESSEEEKEKSKRPKTRGSRKADGNESSDVGDLPSEEEILASPERSEKSASSSSSSENEDEED